VKNKIGKIETLLDGEPREMDEVVGDGDN